MASVAFSAVDVETDMYQGGASYGRGRTRRVERVDGELVHVGTSGRGCVQPPPPTALAAFAHTDEQILRAAVLEYRDRRTTIPDVSVDDEWPTRSRTEAVAGNCYLPEREQPHGV